MSPTKKSNSSGAHQSKWQDTNKEFSEAEPATLLTRDTSQKGPSLILRKVCPCPKCPDVERSVNVGEEYYFKNINPAADALSTDNGTKFHLISKSCGLCVDVDNHGARICQDELRGKCGSGRHGTAYSKSQGMWYTFCHEFEPDLIQEVTSGLVAEYGSAAGL